MRHFAFWFLRNKNSFGFYIYYHFFFFWYEIRKSKKLVVEKCEYEKEEN